MKTHLLYSFIGAILGIISISILIISIMMDSPWAYIVAIVGSAIVSLILRLTRIVNTNSGVGVVIGLAIGSLLCILPLKWLEATWASTNKSVWILTIFVFTQGLSRLFISDSQLANWIKLYLSRKNS